MATSSSKSLHAVTDVEKAEDSRTTQDATRVEVEKPHTASAEDGNDDKFLVELDPAEDPRNMPNFRKWIIVFVVSCGALCSTCSSSMVSR